MLLFELAQVNDSNWLLIGGQMMYVLAVEHGTQLPRPTSDVDVVVDVRARPGGTQWLASWLIDRGFEQDTPSADGISHRFIRPANPGPGMVVVDVLGPDGLGPRTRLTTVPPGYTVQTPGATQGFRRSEQIDVGVRAANGQRRTGRVRRPNLLGALILKSEATALAVRVNPDRDWQDCALLLSMAPDPYALTTDLTRKDRQRLARLAGLRDRAHPGWMTLNDENYRRGMATLDILLGR